MGPRDRAWKTRREKYGERGHAGSYGRPASVDIMPLARIVAFVHGAGFLTESQIAKIIGRDLIETRKLRDEGRDDLYLHRPRGEWARHAMDRMEW